MKQLLYCLMLGTIIVSGCKSTRNIAVPPETPSRYLPALPASDLNIPIKIYMKPILNVMDSGTAKEFTNDKWPDYTQSSCDFRYSYRFLRSPFSFSCVNNKVTIGFRGYYQIAGAKRICAFDKQVSPWVGGSCGFGKEALRKVDISISSTLEFLPNHQLRTTTKLNDSKPIDKCEVTILQTDITGQIMDSIRASVNSYCTTFDQFVQTLNKNALLSQWRSGNSKVMPFSKYGYLNLNPQQYRMGRFNVTKDTLYFSVGFTGTPKFGSDSINLATRAGLPPLINNNTNSGISTYLDAVYEYRFLNKLLNDSLHDKPFELEGRTFVIKDVTISGTNEGKINIDVSFTGNRKGLLHLSGTPVLDSAGQVLTMPDISFAIDTKDMMVNLAQSLFRKKILKKLKDQSVFDIAALMQRNRSVIETRMNQPLTPWLRTQGKLHDIRVLGLLPQKEYIQIQAFIKADLNIIGTPPASLMAGF